jgi:ribosomal protein S7
MMMTKIVNIIMFLFTGKSNTYNRIVAPALKIFQEKTGNALDIETYTVAGLHSHQELTEGYGLITSGNEINIYFN